tara:strand:+ start:1101 stop:1604 length:504 start_codon:yes stop_codon:yes gene_type:complete
MKNILLIPTLLLSLTGSESIKQEVIEVIDNTVIDIIEPEVNLINGKLDNREELITAMAWVESGGNPATIGDINLPMPSVGLLQIRPIMVREVNRILRKQGLDKRFKNSDRKDGDKSIEMFNIWADAYHLNSSFEKMARNWNGGPRGYKKTATSHYWTKVTNYAKLNL